jgi:hypothetical protein
MDMVCIPALGINRCKMASRRWDLFFNVVKIYGACNADLFTMSWEEIAVSIVPHVVSDFQYHLIFQLHVPDKALSNETPGPA